MCRFGLSGQTNQRRENPVLRRETGIPFEGRDGPCGYDSAMPHDGGRGRQEMLYRGYGHQRVYVEKREVYRQERPRRNCAP